MEWHIGCSGFHYKHWKERFYPEGLPQKKWFDYYCQQFKTLELNVTFYRFPQLSFLQNWHANSPDDFRFAVKAPRAITHYRNFINTIDFISSFYETINNGLQQKLGPVLFQMPPNFQFDEDKLERVINSLDPSFRNVFEPRHSSWWNNKVYMRRSYVSRFDWLVAKIDARYRSKIFTIYFNSIIYLCRDRLNV